MSLYDDEEILDTAKKSDSVAGWASGITKLQQSQNQNNKSNLTSLTPQFPKFEPRRQLAPTQFARKNTASNNANPPTTTTTASSPFSLRGGVKGRKGKGFGGGLKSFTLVPVDPEWQFENEYDPYFPNEYEKALKELRDRRDREAEEENRKRKLEEEEGDYSSSREGREERERKGGVAIAPPPSLNPEVQEEERDSKFTKGGSGFSGGLGAAAKIMAKYGYKEGSGLGRLGQGMSTALQVEKTSHRIGRIIHEKDSSGPKEGVVNLMGASSLAASYMEEDLEFEMVPPPAPEPEDKKGADEAEEQLKNPSKVLLLTNMVGPGEVDDELEPEVKEECLKYGEVAGVVVFQMPDVDSEDSIRIFVEFNQVQSSVKAFMDLNGRYFGGRQVKASFYDPEKFNNLELTL